MWGLKAAAHIYRNKELWNVLINNAISSDFSWHKSSREYIKVYREVLSGIVSSPVNYAGLMKNFCGKYIAVLEKLLHKGSYKAEIEDLINDRRRR